MKACVEIKDLQVAYQKTLVLKQLSVSIECGKITGVIGPNGSGKTTFLKAVLDLVPTLSGKIRFDGRPLSRMRNEIAYVPQRESVDWDFPASVADIVSMGRYNPSAWWQRLRSNDREIVAQAIEKVNLTPFRSRQIGQLSGGQQQRVFLARALAQEASVIFMDEPFAGVDMASQDAILNVLSELRSQGKTIVIVHHDLSTVAEWFDNVILLNNRLVASGTVKEVMQPEILAGAYGTSLLFQKEQ
jgi:ABC-type Mn2+/Zn2+ transport system ATPase subunit